MSNDVTFLNQLSKQEILILIVFLTDYNISE